MSRPTRSLGYDSQDHNEHADTLFALFWKIGHLGAGGWNLEISDLNKIQQSRQYIGPQVKLNCPILPAVWDMIDFSITNTLIWESPARNKNYNRSRASKVANSQYLIT